MFRILSSPIVELALGILILTSVGLLVVEQTLELAPATLALVRDIEVIVTFILGVELALRLWLAKKKLRFLRRYWPDMLALAPVFSPLRFLWMLRILRLFRLGVIVSRRLGVFRDVVRSNVYELWALGVATILLVIGASVASYTIESDSNSEFSTLTKAFWWSTYSIIAGEPIGGSPGTTGGRALLVVVMLGGSTLFAALTGIVSATMVDRLAGRKDLYDMDIDELESHIVVCGWNAGVPAMIGEISRDERLKGLPLVLVSDRDDPLRELRNTGAHGELLYFFRGDHARLEVLRRAGIERASRAVVMADASVTAVTDRDARSVLAALTIEKLNPRIHCTVELMDEANEGHLRVAGVEAIVMRNDLAGRVLAIACRDPAVANVLMDLATLTFGQTLVRRRPPLDESPFADLVDRLKRSSGVLVIGVERGGRLELNPTAQWIVRPSDWLIVIDYAGSEARSGDRAG